ncbi:MAG: MFS transporter [Candidatus Dormibacteria bacterium]
MASRPSRFAPLARPRFTALWAGGMISWYGDFLTIPALLIICYRLGGEFAVGLLFVFQTAPLLVLLPLGGALGDRGDRRRRLVALDLVRAALAAATIAGSQGHLLPLVLLATAGSRSAAALYDPGRRRLIAVVLPGSLVGSGSSLLSVGSESAIVVAPALGALLLLVISPTWLLAIDGVTFLISATLIARVGPQPAVWLGRVASARRSWHSLRRGFDLIFADHTTRLFVLSAGMGAALASVIQVYFVPLAQYVFHVGTNQVGVMYVLVGGASVLGSAVAVRRPQVRRQRLALIGYFHLVVVVVIGLAVGPAAVGVAVAAFAASGALQEVWGLNRVQTTTPRDGVGQAMGATLWCLFAGRALGAAVAAWGATHLGREEFLASFAAVAVAVCLLTTLRGQLLVGRNPASWPPGGPPLPL